MNTMKKTFGIMFAVLLCMLFADALADVEISGNFPDYYLREYVLQNFDTDRNKKLSDDEIKNAKVISLTYKSVETLKGIEYLTELTSLYCGGTYRLRSMDISKNTELRYLNVSKSLLDSIDVSNNTKLESLECGSNRFHSLDVSKNTELRSLNCRFNWISSLDVSNCPELVSLDCGQNSLSSLDVSRNTKLRELFCDDNELKTADVSYCSPLCQYVKKSNIIKAPYINCWENESEERVFTVDNDVIVVAKGVVFGPHAVINSPYYFPDANFRRYITDIIDINEDDILYDSELKSVTELYVRKEQISSLEGIKYFPNLKTLECDSNHLTALNLSKNPELRYLDCSDNSLESLNIEKNVNLRKLYCSNNQLSSLIISKNTELSILDCSNNQLSSLNASKNTALKSLICENNRLSSLNILNTTKLEELICCGNKLRSIDLSSSPILRSYIQKSDRTANLKEHYDFWALRDEYWDYPDENIDIAVDHPVTVIAGKTISQRDTLTIPDSMSVIEEEAFAGTSAQIIIINNNCGYIGERAFAHCPDLLYVSVPESTEIAENAFEGCGNAVIERD